jgi:hypothetical protein
MSAETAVVPVLASRDSSHRLAARAVRQFKAQVEDWYDECRALTDWEDENLIDERKPDKLAEHARMLDELERVGRWLSSAMQSADFPDRASAELVALTLRDLADVRALWHGTGLSEAEKAHILKTCFHDS